jgi:GTPase SAR1 family protein
MVRINKSGEVFIKLLYWGCVGSGKTTVVDTLYRLTKEGKNREDLTPSGNPVKIAIKSGSTSYFDRGIFQSKEQAKIFYHVYTVTSQARFSPLRKKIFLGTDGLIFVFDAQRSKIEDNINSLKELKNVVGHNLNFRIPMLVMVNKQDLPNLMEKNEVERILNEEGLFHYPSHKINTWNYPIHDQIAWNPIIYGTIALYSNSYNVYEVFEEIARRTTLNNANNYNIPF